MGVRLQLVFTQGRNHRGVPVRRWAMTYVRAIRRLPAPVSGGRPWKSTT
ncbi:hypothetical protein AB0L41_11800 [Amycolatopsis mediterranei]